MSLQFTTLQKQHARFFAPANKIVVDGKDLLRDLKVEIASVQVDNTLKGMDRFTFTVNSTFNFERREFQHLQDTFAFGKPVLIYMGYAGDRDLTQMMRGIITGVQTSFPSSGLPQIVVSGYDLSFPMSKRRTEDNWDKKTDTFVVQSIAKEHGLGTKVEDTKVEIPKREKSQESDLELVEKLAERNGFESYVFDKTLYFRPPRNGSPVVVALEWGKGLVSFAPEINISQQVSKVEVSGWDVQQKKEILGVATRGEEPGRVPGRRSGAEYVKSVVKDEKDGILKVRMPVFSKQEAEQRAAAILKKRAEMFVQGSGESIGIPEIMPDTNIDLKGLGSLFDRAYYIEQTTHTISTSGYRTTFKIKDTTI